MEMNLPLLRAEVFQFTPHMLSPCDRLTMHTVHYEPIRFDRFEHVVMREGSNVESRVSHQDLFDMLQDGDASIEYGYHSSGQVNLRDALRGKTLSDFTASEIKRAKFLAGLCQRYLDEDAAARANKGRVNINDDFGATLLEWSGYGLKPVRADQAENNAPPSVTSFREQLAKYTECGYTFEALLPRYHGPGRRTAYYDADSLRLWRQYARGYISKNRPKVTTLFNALIADIDDRNNARLLSGEAVMHKPSIKKFRSLIAELNQFAVKAGREGFDAARRYYASVRRSYGVTRPGERIEIDTFNVDLFAFLVKTELWWQFSKKAQAEIESNTETMRIYFVTAVDTATRRCVALKAGLSANSATAVGAMEMIMRDKTHLSELVGATTPWSGQFTPEFIITDNGSEFIAEVFRAKLRQLHIDETTAAAGEPARRPFIESFIGTLQAYLVDHFQGRSFSSVTEKGDYKAEEHTSLSVDELVKVTIRVICDIYHNAPHEGLGGNSPHNEFIALCKAYPPNAPPSHKRMREVFGFKHMRMIRTYGITYMGIPYNSEALQRLRRQFGKTRFEIKVDRSRIKTISVKHGEEWIEVENSIGLDETFTLAEWTYALRKNAFDNVVANKNGLKVMRATILHLRETGVSAALRAELGPDVPTPAEIERLEKHVVGGNHFHAAEADEAMPAPSLPDDPLRSGQVGHGLPDARAPKPERAQKDEPQPTHNQFDGRAEL